MCCAVLSRSVMPNSKTFCNPPGSSVHGIFLGRNTKVVCHFLLQGFFPSQGSNPHPLGLLHCRQILCQLSHYGSPFSLVGTVVHSVMWFFFLIFSTFQFCLVWSILLSRAYYNLFIIHYKICIFVVKMIRSKIKPLTMAAFKPIGSHHSVNVLWSAFTT